MLRLSTASVLFLLAVGAFAQKTETEVRAVYKQMNAMFAKRDSKGLVALFEKSATSDFVSVMGKTKVGRAKFKEDIKNGFMAKDFPLVQTKVLSSRTSGDTLILSVLWMVNGKGPDGKPFALKSTATDTWTKTPKGYRLKKTYDAQGPQPVKN